MKISIVQLIKAKACPEQVKLFRKLFGKEAGVTLKNCEKAGKAGMSFCWAIANLFPDKQEAWNKATAPAWETFDRAIANAQETFDKATAPAQETFNKEIAPAQETYYKATAKAFYKVMK